MTDAGMIPAGLGLARCAALRWLRGRLAWNRRLTAFLADRHLTEVPAQTGRQP